MGDMVPVRKGCESGKPSLLLSQGGSHARQGGAHPNAPQGYKYKPLGAPRCLPIDIHSSESHRRSPQGGGRSAA
jgi:hypothetical protein